MINNSILWNLNSSRSKIDVKNIFLIIKIQIISFYSPESLIWIKPRYIMWFSLMNYRARAFHDTAQNRRILGGGALETNEGPCVNNSLRTTKEFNSRYATVIFLIVFNIRQLKCIRVIDTLYVCPGVLLFWNNFRKRIFPFQHIEVW